MPHYANGDQADVGDGVIGVGYNRKHGQAPATIVGRLTSITPGSASCNCQVVGVEVVQEGVDEFDRPLRDILGQWFWTTNAQGEKVRVRLVHDYSDCGQFAAVDGKMMNARGDKTVELPNVARHR